MKRVKKILAFLYIITAFAGCSKNEREDNKTKTDIYLFGYMNSATIGPVFKLWKSGIATNLSGNVSGVAISGNDIFTAGYEGSFAKYWINDVATNLTDGKNSAYATAVAVNGTDVHIIGIERVNDLSFIKYWKNGVAINLGRVAGSAQAHAVAVNGADIYAVGSIGNTAVLWKNGVATNLTDGKNNADAIAVAISGTDVYITGYEDRAAIIWKNGVSTNLTDGKNTSGRAYAITIVGNDVYVAGSIYNNQTPSTAAYWKNGVIRPQDSINPGTRRNETYAYGIAVSDNDVYLVGEERIIDTNGKTIAKYWKNGAAQPLPTDGSGNTPTSLRDIMIK